MKTCSKCKTSKELFNFGKHKHTRDRLDSWCKKCRNDRRKDPRVRKLIAESKQRRIDADPNKHKDKVLRQKFGITIEFFNDALEMQNHVCAICKRPETKIDPRRGKVKTLSVDHCHQTGIVRGLLCDRCNTSIGKFDDNPELLKSAAKYLERNK